MGYELREPPPPEPTPPIKAMNYWNFIRRHPRLLAFGFVTATFSAFGQTYFISLFSAEIRQTFDLTHGEFGALFSIATLASAISLIWPGRLIDLIDLRTFTLAVAVAMIASCFFFAVAPSTILLVVAIYVLRVTGQGLLPHISMTSLSRYFEAERGRALSIGMIGYPSSQAFLPIVAVAVAAAVGWRDSWIIIGAGVGLILPAAVMWTLKGHDQRHRRYLAQRAQATAAARSAGRQWSRAEVLRDPRFYIVLPAILGPNFVVPGIFFHQVHLVTVKGWDLTWFAAAFVGFSVSMIVASLVVGPLIDRAGATRLLPYILLPIAAGLTALASFDAPIVALVYMALAGLTMAATHTTAAAMWAEVYGVAHLGSIRALATSLIVFASSFSPFAIGWFLDRGARFDSIIAVAVAYVLLASVLAAFAFRQPIPAGEDPGEGSLP